MAVKEQTTIKFPNIFNIDTGRSQLSTGQVSISTNLALLLRTSPGELFGDPYFGSRLTEYLFDPNREALRDIIQEEIYTVVNRYEPRAEITWIDFWVDENKENILHIKITYKNVNTGLTELFQDILDLDDSDNYNY